jgi:DNA-binding NarL/FixJ family response regulator
VTTIGPAARIRPGGASAPRGPGLAPAEHLDQGRRALAAGQWAGAVDLLRAAAAATTGAAHAEALELLSAALFGLGQEEQAFEVRERAYVTWRRHGDDAAAAVAAAWLAREHAGGTGNRAASQGWLARAETLAGAASDPAASGWVALTRAVLTGDPVAQAAAAAEALDLARRARDGDLEVLALGRLGLARTTAGLLEEGQERLDEAMAAATGGEAALATLAALCCDLVAASELVGDLERFAQWSDVVEGLAAREGHPSLLASCATCCAEALMAGGDWHGGEAQLRAALAALRQAGHPGRCIAPAAKLAELLVLQGRLEEAAQVLADDDSDETLLVRGRVALARGDATTALALLERCRRRRGGDTLLTAPALALAVDAHLALGDHRQARMTADRLRAVAAGSGHPRTVGRAALAQARVAVAGGEHDLARALLEESLDHLSGTAPGALETADAHLELARLHAAGAPKLAAAEARAALIGFEAAGATHAVDAAAALLRTLGDRSRVGEKGASTLTGREAQVLQLVAQGLTNAEIAGRLFISPKTAGNHVSSILTKLGLRSRVEAAAYATSQARR